MTAPKHFVRKVSLASVVLLAASVCVACGAPGNAPSGAATEQARSTTPVQTTTTSKPDDLVLGPNGVGALRLGMPHDDIVATGTAQAPLGARHDGWPSGCRVLQYRPERLGRIPGDSVNGAVSPGQGLETMYATRRMATPEGIRLGSTVLEVRAAYNRPDLTSGDLVTIPASPHAVYRIQLAGVVTSISLEMRRLDCTI
jgi:hypothetical protein